jgi:leader peptidase (prepilin peptidase)/N-methyltransferase
LALKRKCRHCDKPISWLYPFVEILTAVVMTALFLNAQPMYIPAYFIFFSALIVTIRSDIETMLISRYVTVFLIPVGILGSYLELLPISATESITSAILGGSILWLIGQLFYLFTNKVGLGQGDVDLLAFIGSFIGLLGIWFTVMIASILGSIFGLTFMFYTGTQESVRIPFGPFLAISAIGYVLWAQNIIPILFGT